MKQHLKNNFSGKAARNGGQSTNPIFGKHQDSWTNNPQNSLYTVTHRPVNSARKMRWHANLRWFSLAVIWTIGLLVLGFILFALLSSR